MGKKRAVIVEDEALIAGSIEQKLTGMGFEVEKTFYSGEAAFRYFQNLEMFPDLILMDILLEEGKDGIEIASAIRGIADVPIIFLSALGDEQTIQRAANLAKPHHFLVKPFSESEFRTTVEIVMHRADLERQLRESETRYRNISELSSDFAYSVLLYPNGEVEVEWVTGAAERITGYTVLEIIEGINYTMLFPAGDLTMLKHFQRRILRGEAAVIEHRVIAKDGSLHWIRNKAKPEIEKQAGAVKRVFGAVEEITELKRIEEVERSKEQNFQALIKRMNDGIIILDKAGLITFVNDLICSMTGFKKHELIGEHVQVLAGRARDKAVDSVLEEVPYETTCRTKEGGRVNVLVSPKVLHDGKGDFAGSFSVVTNIEKQKEKEYYLRHQRELSRAQYENIFENTPVGLIEEDLSEIETLVNEKASRVKDISSYLRKYPRFLEKLLSATRFTNVNKAALELLKVRDAREFERRLPEIMMPETMDFFREGLIELIEGKQRVKREIPMRDAEGNILYVLADMSLPKREDGLKCGILSLIDMTEQHRYRKHEKYLERKFQSLFEHVPFGIVIFNKEGGICNMNNVFRKLWAIGPKKEKSLYREYSIFFDPQPFIRKNMKLIKQAFTGKLVQLPATEYVPRRAGKNSFGRSEPFWFYSYFFPISGDNDSEGEIALIIEDISEMKQAEDEIRTHEKMYKHIVEFSPEAIAVSDENRNILYVSQKTLDLFRFHSKEEVIGKSILSWIHVEDKATAIENIKKIFSGASGSNTYRLMRSDNTPFIAEIISAAVIDATGKCKNMISIIRDKNEV